jgi:hypothetical protein
MQTSTFLIGRSQVWGLAPREVGYFFLTTGLANAGMRTLTPNWNHGAACDCPPQPGLWAI